MSHRERGSGGCQKQTWEDGGGKHLLNPPAPSAPPDEQRGLGPDPGAHGDAGSKHSEQVDLLHQEAGAILDLTVRNGLLGGQPDGHIGLAPMRKDSSG